MTHKLTILIHAKYNIYKSLNLVDVINSKLKVILHMCIY